MIRLIAGKSQTSGTGLWTYYDIKKGTVIGVFQCRPCAMPWDAKGPYSLPMPDGTTVLMTDDFKYINHRDVPNVCLWDDFTVTALKDISAGTELFSDYGQEWKGTCGHEVL